MQEGLKLDDMLKLNVGCGGNKLAGWVNIDLENADINLDVRNGLPYADGEVDLIYSEHFIEHLTYEEATHFFHDCYKALRVGGVIRTLTPDLEGLTRSYLDDNWIAKEWVRKYCPNSFMNGCFMLNASFREWGHKFLYDQPTLEICLSSAGFVRGNILRQEFNVSSKLELCCLDTRDDSLIIEGVR